jgi:hypothetical protein
MSDATNQQTVASSGVPLLAIGLPELKKKRSSKRYKMLHGIVVGLLRQRDGELCGICGQLLGSDVTIDHIVPISAGGSVDDCDNLRLAHHRCNLLAYCQQVSDVHRVRNSAALRGRTLSEKHKVALGVAMKTVWATPEQRAFISERMRGVPKPPGFGERISAALSGQHGISINRKRDDHGRYI